MQDLSWSCHMNTVVKKARQHLYHLRRLRDFKLPFKVLRNFYSCTIESILTGNIANWFGNSTMQDRQALQRVVRSAERIIHTKLTDLNSIYSKRTKARKIVKDLSHPNNGLFSLLQSEKLFRSLKANTERLRKASSHRLYGISTKTPHRTQLIGLSRTASDAPNPSPPQKSGPAMGPGEELGT
ncbi:hypothetical protein QTP86_023094 [Hemibagrus guttatus]|nr:hypothetical protein QTP86_023094 [Hemibagrus guttatus]